MDEINKLRSYLETTNGEVGILGQLVRLLDVLGQGHDGGDGVLGDGGGRVGGNAADADAVGLAELNRDLEPDEKVPVYNSRG